MKTILLFLSFFICVSLFGQQWGAWRAKYNSYEGEKQGIYTPAGRGALYIQGITEKNAVVFQYMSSDLKYLELTTRRQNQAFSSEFYFFDGNGERIDKQTHLYGNPNVVYDAAFYNALCNSAKGAWKIDSSPDYLNFSLDGFEDAVAWLTGRKTKAQREAEEKALAEQRKLERERKERERQVKVKEDKLMYPKILSKIKENDFSAVNNMINALNFSDQFPYTEEIIKAKREYDLKKIAEINANVKDKNYESALKKYLTLQNPENYNFVYKDWQDIAEKLLFDYMPQSISTNSRYKTKSLKEFSEKFLINKYGNESYALAQNEITNFIASNKEALKLLSISEGSHRFLIKTDGGLFIDDINKSSGFTFKVAKRRYYGIDVPVNTHFNIKISSKTKPHGIAVARFWETYENPTIGKPNWFIAQNKKGETVVLYSFKKRLTSKYPAWRLIENISYDCYCKKRTQVKIIFRKEIFLNDDVMLKEDFYREDNCLKSKGVAGTMY